LRRHRQGRAVDAPRERVDRRRQQDELEEERRQRTAGMDLAGRAAQGDEGLLREAGETQDHQQGGALREVAGLEGGHGQRPEGDEFAQRNEDHAGDREHQHQRQGQQHVHRAAGDAVLGQDGEDR